MGEGESVKVEGDIVGDLCRNFGVSKADEEEEGDIGGSEGRKKRGR